MGNTPEPAELDIALGERRLRVVRCGSGPVDVVFESGGGCGADDWLPVQRLLPEATTWSYDRAGEGKSPANGDWSLDACVRDLGDWLTAAGITRPAVFVGHSLGCHIIRAHVAEHPQAAAGLVLVDARPPHFERTVLDAGIAIPVPPPESSIFKEFTLADDLVRDLPAPSGFPAVAICSERFDGAPGDLGAAETDEVAGLWRQAQAGIAYAIGQGAVTVVPGTGHRIPAEAPERVAAVVRDVIARRRGTGGRVDPA